MALLLTFTHINVTSSHRLYSYHDFLLLVNLYLCYGCQNLIWLVLQWRCCILLLIICIQFVTIFTSYISIIFASNVTNYDAAYDLCSPCQLVNMWDSSIDLYIYTYFVNLHIPFVVVLYNTVYLTRDFSIHFVILYLFHTICKLIVIHTLCLIVAYFYCNFTEISLGA